MRNQIIIFSIIALAGISFFGCQQQTTNNQLNDADWETWFAQMANQKQQQNTKPDFIGRFARCDALDKSYSQTRQEQALACCKAPEATWIMHSNQVNQYCRDLELANDNGE